MNDAVFHEVDFNLLLGLDALLLEGSVIGAARRLGLSTSAMSRMLTRLRSATGDPLLVRAGRGLVPTPRAIELRKRVHALSRGVLEVLSPSTDTLDLASLEATFTVRASEGFMSMLSAPLVAAIAASAPRARLRFTPKPDKDPHPLREGYIDLEIGVLGASAPELQVQPLFQDKFVGVARMENSLFAGDNITPELYASCGHVVASKNGNFTGPVDDALAELGLRRTIAVVVPGFPDAIRIARASNLIALVPRSCLGNRLTSQSGAMIGLRSFELPVVTPVITVSAIWHPQLESDPAHRWLRETLVSLCRAAYPNGHSEQLEEPISNMAL